MTATIIRIERDGTRHIDGFTDADLAALYTERERLDLTIGRTICRDGIKHSAAGIVLPFPNMITGNPAQKLAEARQTAQWAGQGGRVSLPALLVARDALEAHGGADDATALVQIEAAVLATRREAAVRQAFNPKRGTIRRELLDLAGLAGLAGVCLAVVALLKVGV